MRGALCVTLFAAACASGPVRRADELVERGKYVEAADDYDEQVMHEFNERVAASLKRKRDDARERALVAMRTEMRAHARTPDDVIREIKRINAQRALWRLDVEELTNEQAGLIEHSIAVELAIFIDDHRPLAAAQALTERRQLLLAPALQPAAERLRASVRTAGAASCRTIAARAPKTPFAAALVASYCHRFGAETADLPPLPGGFSKVEVSGTIERANDKWQPLLRDALQLGLAGSPFFVANSPAVARVAVGGMQRIVFHSNTVARQATYIVSVKDAMGSGSHGEERSFEYTVDEESEDLLARWGGVVALGTDSFEFGLELNDATHGITQTYYAPYASVFPVSFVHTKPASWFERQLTAATAMMIEAARRRWNELYCAGEQFGVEEAARCVHGDFGTYPPAVAAALAPVFGEETAGLLELANL